MGNVFKWRGMAGGADQVTDARARWKHAVGGGKSVSDPPCAPHVL